MFDIGAEPTAEFRSKPSIISAIPQGVCACGRWNLKFLYCFSWQKSSRRNKKGTFMFLCKSFSESDIFGTLCHVLHVSCPCSLMYCCDHLQLGPLTRRERKAVFRAQAGHFIITLFQYRVVDCGVLCNSGLASLLQSEAGEPAVIKGYWDQDINWTEQQAAVWTGSAESGMWNQGWAWGRCCPVGLASWVTHWYDMPVYIEPQGKRYTWGSAHWQINMSKAMGAVVMATWATILGGEYQPFSVGNVVILSSDVDNYGLASRPSSNMKGLKLGPVFSCLWF